MKTENRILLLQQVAQIQSDLIFCDLLQQQNSDKELHSTPCAPKLWNSLPLHLCKSPSLTGFKKGLKTFIFGQFLESGSLFLSNDFKTCNIWIVNRFLKYFLIPCLWYVNYFIFSLFNIVKRHELRI